MKYQFLSTLLLACMCMFAQEKERNPGVWKNIALTPGVGRIVDVEFDPNNGDRMYAAPDANGIWYTEDQGRHWECITDNIPELEARITDSEIIVDPDNFDKIYYVSKYGHYYITEDRGKHWVRVKDKNGEPIFLTDFKRSIVARDKNTGDVIMVCTTIGRDHGKKSGSWGKGLHVSHDLGMTWKHFPSPSHEEEYLEIAFHPTNPKIIYAPTTHKLYKSIDGGLTFKNVFDFPKPNGSFSSVTTIESNPDWVYLITTNKSDRNKEDNFPKTALYLSKDKAKTWDTIQNMDKGIGYKKSVYGSGGFVGSWLHCFAVNPSNPNEMITAMNSMTETTDGGKNWDGTGLIGRHMSRQKDGSIRLNKFASHSADSHVIKFHPKHKSRAYKACDSGLYMRDPEIGFDNWVEITGDMMAMLFYSVKVNEFGDRYVIGNTQDVGIESYQYKEWQWVRGYEGDVVFIHPYTNIAYFPSCRCGNGNEIKGLFELGRRDSPNITSWGRPQIAVNYRNPEEAVVVYQSPKDRRKRVKQVYHIKDKDQTANMLKLPATGTVSSFNISRTEDERFTAISSEAILISTDKGNTWKKYKTPTGDITFGAVDPNNPNRIWVGSKKGKVFESLDSGITWNTISEGLPNASILKLIYHEGSPRDLYALAAEGDGQFMRPHGIYYLNANEAKWKKWMDGYNLNGFSDMVIDYPSQKMLASSYGRGVWESDLEAVYERFLQEEVEVVEMSGSKNFRTFGLDILYHLPEYYNYEWMVNGVRKGTNSMFFTSKDIKNKDRISCKLSPKYAPEVVLETKELRLKKVKTLKTLEKEQVLIGNGNSFDLGYYDYFGANQDFTVSFNLKPNSDGVVIANRRFNDHDAKGWLVAVQDGSLILKYTAKYNATGGNEREGDRTPPATEQFRFPIKMDKWNQVVVAFDRDGKVQAYLDGKKVAEKEMNKAEAAISINSLFNLYLFSDVQGLMPMQGAIDELKIWNKAITANEIGDVSEKNMIFYHSFNNVNKNKYKELFTGQEAKVK
ncbi:VPS10 domain-containing protein [Flavivirga spongiicola]|uniref:LamG-like jellyroll fold domain-containing protein n=1 Tax=Flavivirga spongiicola TaxID=421621 RepID=A0ABU7XRZ7_9FLAO|nr:LamG-like jellyroll fold domain-containing protein [Flavivirga sp. MEBiC05379]MDO5978345.1 LamG-like jellyroll fold domain-containing protein [Flavivirga sp. MEBiC05379]